MPEKNTEKKEKKCKRSKENADHCGCAEKKQAKNARAEYSDSTARSDQSK